MIVLIEKEEYHRNVTCSVLHAFYKRSILVVHELVGSGWLNHDLV